MEKEKYRIIGNRDVGILNAEINKLAVEGFRPIMMQAAVYPPTEDDTKAKALGGTLQLIVLLQRGD